MTAECAPHRAEPPSILGRRKHHPPTEQPAEESRILVADVVGNGLDRRIARLELPRGDQYIALDAIRNGALIVYPSTGHAVRWEQPTRFAADLGAFIDTHVHATSPRKAASAPHA